MNKIFSEEEFNNAKSKTKLPLICGNCNSVFYKPKHIIQSVIKGNPKNTLEFCSNKCVGEKLHPPTIVICEQCNTEFKKRFSQINYTKHNFCCQSCAAKYNNAHKTKGTRVSKLEKYFQEQLPILYPELEFHFNRKDAIISELDIYVPSLRLAFELNGIFHYESIYGADKLNSIQNNDERKFQACIENKIELCIIDTSSIVNFSEIRANKFLKIIIDIINIRLINKKSN